MVRCNACGGTYEPTTADGYEYYHVCPPLSLAELRDALDNGTLILAPSTADALDSATQLDAKAPLGGDSLSRVDTLLSQLFVPRPGHRDENIEATRGAGAGRIKSEGAGVTAIDDEPPAAQLKG